MRCKCRNMYYKTRWLVDVTFLTIRCSCYIMTWFIKTMWRWFDSCRCTSFSLISVPAEYRVRKVKRTTWHRDRNHLTLHEPTWWINDLDFFCTIDLQIMAPCCPLPDHPYGFWEPFVFGLHSHLHVTILERNPAKHWSEGKWVYSIHGRIMMRST